jgi:hypothetical protein
MDDHPDLSAAAQGGYSLVEPVRAFVVVVRGGLPGTILQDVGEVELREVPLGRVA